MIPSSLLTPPDVARGRAVRRVLVITLVLNLAVAAAKIAYGYRASALAIRADGFHSLTDAANNIVGIVSVAWAARPADRGHPYGHQKIELIAAGFVGALLMFVAYDVGYSALDRMFSGPAFEPSFDNAAYIVLLGTLLVNVWVAAARRNGLHRLGRHLEF